MSASALATYGPAALSTIGGIYAAQTNQNINDDNLRFQREMATNAHQYQVEDMRAAGLNPILSATGGSGAKASGGSNVPVQNPTKDVPSSALMIKQGKKIEAETRSTQHIGTINATQAEIEKLKLKILKDGIELGSGSAARDIARKISEGGSQFSSFVGDRVNDSKATINWAKDKLKSKPKKKLTKKQIMKQKKDMKKFLNNRNK